MKKLKFASHANDKAVIFLFYRWTQIFQQRFLFDIRYLYERVFITVRACWVALSKIVYKFSRITHFMYSADNQLLTVSVDLFELVWIFIF